MSARLCVGIAYWQLDELAQSIAVNLEKLGCQVRLFEHTRLPDDVQMVWAYGPWGSLMPLARQILARPAAARPPLVFLLTEQLPNPDAPEWFNYGISVARSAVDRVMPNTTFPLWSNLAGKGLRFRYYGDLYWLHRKGVLKLLLTDSQITADFLRQRGFHSVCFVLGSHTDWGRELNLERDISVLWLGKPGSPRRRNLLRQIRSELQARGVDMMVVDGEEHPYVFGRKRTILLNRTQIVLNIVRQPWDCNSMRFDLVAPNKALMVSEPLLPHIPAMKPGVHYVEAPLPQLSEAICYYLAHPEERQQIVDAAYELTTTELTMEKAFAGILPLLEQLH